MPRYSEFSPKLVNDPYAKNVALIEIACQECGAVFKVALSSSEEEFKEVAREGLLRYGDPPVSGCCQLGLTMNSRPLRTLQFWELKDREWRRTPELEGELHSLLTNIPLDDETKGQAEEEAGPEEVHCFVQKLEHMASEKK